MSQFLEFEQKVENIFSTLVDLVTPFLHNPPPAKLQQINLFLNMMQQYRFLLAQEKGDTKEYDKLAAQLRAQTQSAPIINSVVVPPKSPEAA